MGDEVRRTQRGNNNAYCREDETGWFDWTGLERHAGVHRFARELIAFRRHRELVGESSDMTLRQLLDRGTVQWHGVKLDAPDWSETSHSLAATIRAPAAVLTLHLMVNAYWEALDFEIPPVEDGQGPWRRFLDTFRAAPEDVCPGDGAPAVLLPTYRVEPRSLVLLVARARERPGQTGG
jgi:glycogen operon protein